MMYTRELPNINKIRELAIAVQSFPVTCHDIVQRAEELHFDEVTVNFLKRFAGDMRFDNQAELLEQCSILEDIIEEGKGQPPERLREGEAD